MEPRIKQLSADLVAKIAAGEVITNPKNVVKELIENSLDAKATLIHVSLKNKQTYIKVKDNGIGFNKEDLPLACVRHTTSKLTSMSDFETLQNYGFRGEALASISQVADVTIISKKKNEFMGSKATYKNGEMTSCKNVAANNGTVIIIENLFYNMKDRQQNLIANLSKEYVKIVEVIQCYAIHCNLVSFQLDKDGRADVISNINAYKKELVKLVLGRNVANNLLEFKHENPNYEYSVSGLVSNTNSSLPRYLFILFINNRLVDCSTLKATIKEIFSDKLMKGSNPFVYLNLSILQKNLDVNLHPSKQEVRYLNQDVINSEISQQIQQCLVDKAENQDIPKLNDSYTQRVNKSFENSFSQDNSSPSVSNFNKPSTSYSISKIPIQLNNRREYTYAQPPNVNSDQKIKKSKAAYQIIRNDSSAKKIDDMFSVKMMTQRTGKTRVIELTSLQQLRDEVESEKNVKMTYQVRRTTLVGILDHRRVLVQHEKFLNILDWIECSKPFLYQQYLINFGNFKSVDFQQNIHLIDLLETFKTEMNITDDLDIEGRVVDLIEQKEMYYDYFSMKITDDGFLRSIPILIDGQRPNLNLLPLLIWNLSFVRYEAEKSCLKMIGKAFADYYSRPLDKLEEQKQNIRNIFSRFKEQFKPTHEHLNCIKPVADLQNLYKIFERC